MSRLTRAGLLAALIACSLATPSMAQQLADRFGGFATDPSAPISIEADRLDVDDIKKTATFRGNVSAHQGEFNIRSRELTVHYAPKASPGGAAVTASAAGGSDDNDITRIVASGKVLVSNGPGNEATGDTADYDVRAQQVTLSGDVVLSQKGNVMRGQTLAIDLASGQSQLKGLQGGGRIIAKFLRPPNKAEGNGDAGGQ